MRDDEILTTIFDPANRANPYALYAELRKTPVSFQVGGPNPVGTFCVSTYREIAALLHDPRVSSDFRKGEQTRNLPTILEQLSFIHLDAPDHDRLRYLATRHFGPPERPRYVDDLRPDIERVARALVDGFDGDRSVDIVGRLAYSLPVTVICAVLGVPREDQPKFHVWADMLVRFAGAQSPEAVVEIEAAKRALREYIAELVARRRREPTDDLLSRMANDDGPAGRMDDAHLIATMSLLLIAGHETTVNLITNGVLTFLRHPEIIERLRRQPELMIATVEELVRYEPPVQMLPNRTTLDDVAIAGVTIPKGAHVVLVLAAGNRDPARFKDPERFIPDRADNAHLGFGGGIHYCFGAPLARLEAQIALREIVERLEAPRLVVDPPPYRESPVLRGPRELLVAIDGVRPARDRRRGAARSAEAGPR